MSESSAPTTQVSSRPPHAIFALVVLCLAVATLVGCAGRDDRPDVILITIDTLRADRIGAYGDDEVATPVLDGLAGRGVRFSRASAVTPVTLPSHASILTGRYPSTHGVRNNGTFRLGDDAVTLAETLHEDGYRTAAVVGAAVLAARYGLAQGFEIYDDAFLHEGRSERRADEVTDVALARVAELDRDAPVLLWAHYFDPHASYAPPPPFDANLDRYRGEIEFTDREIGRLLDGLEQVGRLENAVVVVVSDHGEAFGEHGETHHGLFVYEPTIRVPMIVSWPDRVTGGAVLDRIVSHVDLAPTILGLLGRPGGETFDGIDLSVELFGTAVPESRRGVRVENLLPRLEFGWSALHAFREDDWKYIAAPRPELYDLASDPGEEDNLVDSEARRAEIAAAILADALESAPAATAAESSADPETVAHLRSLGYVGSFSTTDAAATTLPDGTLPDPKDRLEEYRAAKMISTHLALGEFDEAIVEARRTLEHDPENGRVLHALGEALLRSGRPDEGETVYERILETDPQDCMAMWRLGEVVALRDQDTEAADARYGDSLACDPAQPDVWWRRAAIALDRGDEANGSAFLDRAIELDPTNPKYLGERARVAFDAGNPDVAELHWTALLAARPSSAEAATGLGRVASARGDADAAERWFREALTYDPSFAEARADLGTVLLRERDYAAGVEETSRALELDPSLTQARFNLAMGLVRLDRLDEARAELELHALDAPRDPRGWVVLARAYGERGRSNEARSAWQQVLRADPTHAEARQALGR